MCIRDRVGLLPFRNPVQAIVNILKAIPVGVDDAIAEASGDPDNRPLGTDPVTSPFGVGGPELPAPPAADNNANQMFSSRLADDPAAHQDIPEVVGPQEGTVEETPADNVEQGDAAGSGEEEVIEDQVSPGQGTQKLESTTPRVSPKPVTRFGEQIRSALDKIRLPKIRGPIRFDSQRDAKPPSAAQPGTGGNQTTTGEQDSAPSAGGEAGGQAAA